MSQPHRLLVVDDEANWLEQVPIILEGICDVDAYATIDQALAAIRRDSYDIILLDLNFEGDPRSGLEIFRQVHAIDKGVDIILLTGETDREKLRDVFNAGISRCIYKPASPGEIRENVQKVIHNRELKLRFMAQDSGSLGNSLYGNSKAMRNLKAEIARVIRSGSRDILITGPSGSGKDVVAKMIAYQKDRAKRLIPIHCGALNDGVVESELFGHVRGAYTGADRDRVGAFEAAGGGFVFLDEIGEMPAHQQAKLLRVLQERKVQRVGSIQEIDVSFRLISATNVDLEQAIEEKKFRLDLYYRIAKEKLVVPSLAERPEDIPEIVMATLVKKGFGEAISFSDSAMSLLQTYYWPGNVRQLIDIVESLCSRVEKGVVREKDIYGLLPDLAHFPRYAGGGAENHYPHVLVLSEKKRFEKAILSAKGDRDEAAKILGISRATYFRRAKALGLVNSRKLWG